MTHLLLFLMACGQQAPADVAMKIAEDNGLTVVDSRTQVVDGAVVQVTTVTGQAADPLALGAACDAGDLDACHQRGLALLHLGQYAEMEQVWLSLCGKGYKLACGELAYQYSNPYIEIPGRELHAWEIGTRACEMHAQPISCSLLADWMQAGRFGATPDPARAAELVRQSCADGHYWSCEKTGSPATP